MLSKYTFLKTIKEKGTPDEVIGMIDRLIDSIIQFDKCEIMPIEGNKKRINVYLCIPAGDALFMQIGVIDPRRSSQTIRATINHKWSELLGFGYEKEIMSFTKSADEIMPQFKLTEKLMKLIPVYTQKRTDNNNIELLKVNESEFAQYLTVLREFINNIK